MDYKTILGSLAVGVSFAGYIPYLRDVFLRKTKPHSFSWLAWGIIEFIVFFAQLAKGGGSGAWITGSSAGVCLFIAGIAFFRGDTQINKLDYASLGGSLLGIVLWRLTSNPLLAVIFVSIADFLAFIPTFRKSYHHPEQETVTEYASSVLKWVLGLLALRSFNLTTWLFPVSVMLTNGSFVIMSLIRRRTLNKKLL